MNDELIRFIPLRSTSPMANFLNDISRIVIRFLNFIAGDIATAIRADPLLFMGFGFIAIFGVIGIVGRLLSRD